MSTDVKLMVFIYFLSLPFFFCMKKRQKNTPGRKLLGVCVAKDKRINQPQPLELQPSLLLQPPPPRGLVELIEKPDLIPASMKSTLIDPQVSSKLLSTRNVRPSCSYLESDSFGSSRASPKDGPDHPPDIRAIRRAESILFSSMYDLRFCVANSVTSNITNTPYLLF